MSKNKKTKKSGKINNDEEFAKFISDVSENDMNQLSEKYKLNLKLLGIDMIKYGYKVELEHGLVNSKTNITNDDKEMTFKIMLAHIMEYPDYYIRLFKLENEAEEFWSSVKKINIFL